MDGGIFAWCRPADAAVGGLIVLATGSLAARLCRQPVRRARVIVLTLLGAVAVPALGALPVVPRWSAGLLPASASALNEGAGPTATDLPRPHVAMGPDAAIDDASPAEPPGVAAAPAQTRPALPAPTRRWEAPSLGAIAVGCYLAASAGFAAWWLVGQMLLWRVTRSARPAPGTVRAVLGDLAGLDAARVLLLESDRIDLPLTYTWARPVILLPCSLCDGSEPDALRYALAHEWSHVERRDARAWNLACLAGLVLFYQPLFWWLRRQLRLCQDYLADARAAAAGSAEDYAAYLVRLTRQRRARTVLAALGIGGRRSNLYRRVTMLVSRNEPLEQRCRMAWSATVIVAAAVIVLASGLRLGAAQSVDEEPAQGGQAVKDVAKPSPDGKNAGELLRYKGTVIDKETGKPIPGATVVVRRSILRPNENRMIQETRHTTGADGTYAFEIPPEQSSMPYLYIELDVEHPDYAPRDQFGYALGMIRKNELLNERPFFETVEMRPAKPITGRVETPDGRPASGVVVLAYSRSDKGWFAEYGSFARAETDAEGRYRLPIATPGHAAYWVLPRDHAVELHVVPEGKRGDMGTITLKKGVSISGRVVDVQGKAVGRVFVEIERKRGGEANLDANGLSFISNVVRRIAETDADGRFTFAPLPPGEYLANPTESNYDGDRKTRWDHRPLDQVFVPMTLAIKEGEAHEPLEMRASPVAVIGGQWLDSSGKPKGGWSSFVFGRIDGSSWSATTNPDAQGRFSLKVPRGLEQTEFQISTNEHTASRYRIGKDGPLSEGRKLKLGTLDHDVKDIEIVRYVAPIVVVNATTGEGKQIEGFKATAKYTDPATDPDRRLRLTGGGKQKDALQDEQYDGRYRTSGLLPDREVEIDVSADGFAPSHRKFTLPEGEIEEFTFVLESK